MAEEYVEDMEADPEEDGADQPELSVVERLSAIIALTNIAEVLDEDKRNGIAAQVVEEYEIDDQSRDEWKKVNAEAMKLAMMVAEEKTYPFPKAANVKYPLLTTAALQFSARAYPAIVPGDRIVKCKVNGRDPEGKKAARADRVSEYESWQLTDQMPEWEPDTDRLLVMLPIVGCVFRKRYFDPALGRQVSRLIPAERLVVNHRARSLEETPRATEEMTLYPYEIQERIRDGRFIEFDYSATPSPSDGKDSSATDGDDKDAPHLFLEQHRQLDLDEDGYPEPYIVTVHKGSQKVCRIVANFTEDSARISEDQTKVISIRKRDFYVKYDFLPNPDGGFYGLGLGWLLKSSNEAINTTLNEMLDAGHLANIQGGFVSSALGLREKKISLMKGEWKVLPTSAPINQAVMPISYPGPNDTLFKLLGLLVEMGKEVASIKDVLSGDVKQNMQPTTVLALIEQGMQFFTAIYKRVHRALKAELALHAKLNHEYLTPEEYNVFFDDEEQYDPQQDFDGASEDISPASDPSVSSRMQKLAKAEFVLTAARDNPLVNQEEALRRYFEAADITDLDKLLVPPPPPDPLMTLLGELEAQDKMAGITEKLTKALLNVANAEAAEEGPQLEQYKIFLDALGMEMSAQDGQQEGGPGGLSGMEGAPDDAMGAGLSQAAIGDANGGQEAGVVPFGPAPGGMAVPAA
jgi:chaperonin GroES